MQRIYSYDTLLGYANKEVNRLIIIRKEVLLMAKECVITGRKARTGNTRSHALNSSRRTWGANLQKVRILVNGKPKRVWVSARALKSGKVQRV